MSKLSNYTNVHIRNILSMDGKSIYLTIKPSEEAIKKEA